MAAFLTDTQCDTQRDSLRPCLVEARSFAAVLRGLFATPTMQWIRLIRHNSTKVARSVHNKTVFVYLAILKVNGVSAYPTTEAGHHTDSHLALWGFVIWTRRLFPLTLAFQAWNVSQR